MLLLLAFTSTVLALVDRLTLKYKNSVLKVVFCEIVINETLKSSSIYQILGPRIMYLYLYLHMF
jgi:hypothetical protein